MTTGSNNINMTLHYTELRLQFVNPTRALTTIRFTPTSGKDPPMKTILQIVDPPTMLPKTARMISQFLRLDSMFVLMKLGASSFGIQKVSLASLVSMGYQENHTHLPQKMIQTYGVSHTGTERICMMRLERAVETIDLPQRLVHRMIDRHQLGRKKRKVSPLRDGCLPGSLVSLL
jgi:hypothetical protein